MACIAASPALTTTGFRARARAPAAGRAARLTVRAEKVLIANTKGGGHAPFGLYLAKELLAKGHTVTILNDGDGDKLASKNPFSQYASLGAEVVWGSPANPEDFPAGSYDVVYDNNGKDLENCQPLIDRYGPTCQQYCFVSSAGMCKDNAIEPMVFEDTPCKDKGHFFVEQYLQEQKVPFTVFRPLYPYGKYTMKDCEQWFMDRIMRDRPIPIPGSGLQLVSLSHYEDCGKLMAAAALNKQAIGSTYNLTSDAALSFDGVALACAKAAGKEAMIVHYDADALGKGAWPFRLGHFFASATKAQVELGWKPEHDFAEDMKECLERYIESGRVEKEIDFTEDDKILMASGL